MSASPYHQITSRTGIREKAGKVKLIKAFWNEMMKISVEMLMDVTTYSGPLSFEHNPFHETVRLSS
jgi:hypothetical protein